MSTLKVNEVRHISNTGTANIVLESNEDTNLQTTSTKGLSVDGTLTVSGVATLNGNTVVGNASTDTMVLTSTVSGFNNFSGFTGEMRMYAGNAAGNSPPAGWLYCNGDTISQTTGNGGNHYNADGKGNDYQSLFNLLKASNDWGNASSAVWGTNTVKTPDFRARTPVGVGTGAANAIGTGSDTAALTVRALGDTTGAENHILVTNEIPAHLHGATSVTAATGVTAALAAITVTQPTHTHTLAHTHAIDPPSTTTNSTGAHTHTLQSSTSSWSGGTAYGSTGTHQGNAQTPPQSGTQSADHTHTLNNHRHSIGAHSHTTPATTTNSQSSSNTGDGGAQTQTTSPNPASGTQSVTFSAVRPTLTSTVTTGAHTHTITTTNATTGGATPVVAANTAHNNISPLIAVNFIIKV